MKLVLILLFPIILFSQVPTDSIISEIDSTYSVCWTIKIETRYDTTDVYLVLPVYRNHFEKGGNWKEICQLELVKGIRIRKTDSFTIGYTDKFYLGKKQVFPLVSFTKQWMEEYKVETYIPEDNR